MFKRQEKPKTETLKFGCDFIDDIVIRGDKARGPCFGGNAGV